jgi:hypothetical protein
VFAENKSTYVSKHFAYCTPVTGAQLHRQRGFRVRMNDNADYPQILEVIEEVPLPKTERKRSAEVVAGAAKNCCGESALRQLDKTTP